MGTQLANFPLEVLDMILAHLVPQDWVLSTKRPACLDLRLVCRRFDAVISRHAIRNVDPNWLVSRSQSLGEPLVKWLLATKLKVVGNTESGLAAVIWDSVLAIGSWRSCNSEPAQVEEYLDAACSLMVISQGRVSVCQQIQMLSVNPVYSRTTKTESRDDRGQALRSERQRAVEAMTRCHSLPVAAYRGDRSIVETLLQNKVDLNSWAEFSGSALYAAAFAGHTDIARLLIEHGARITRHPRGTPLEAAAGQGHIEILRLLLDVWTKDTAKVEENDQLNHCLFWASINGRARVVQLLLAQPGVDPHATASPTVLIHSLLTVPLLGAAPQGCAEVISVLLAWPGVQPNFQFADGSTTLLWASRLGLVDVVQLLLLRQEINPNIPDNSGRTPLTAAAEGGYEKIVRLLAKRNDTKPTFGHATYCPLRCAIARGHTSILEFLSKHYGIELAKYQYQGLSLLLWAAVNGQAGVVDLLFREGVSPNHEDPAGRTPLGIAAHGGHDDVIRVFLAHKDIVVKKKAFFDAIHEKHETIVRLFLEHPDTDPNEGDEHRNPLGMAILQNHTGIIRLLLNRPDVDVNLTDRSGSTPLMIAVETVAHSDVVELLLSHNDVNPHIPGMSGHSPLQTAIARGNELTVQKFIDCNHADPTENGIGGTLLWQAAGFGSEMVMRLLLKRPDVDPNLPSEEHRGIIRVPVRHVVSVRNRAMWNRKTYRFEQAILRRGKETPLCVATRKGKASNVKLLLQQSRINLNIVDSVGRSVLWSAAFHRQHAILRLLLAHDATSLNLPDFQGWTPLLILVASPRIHMPTLEVLLNHVDIDPNTCNKEGWTPLLIAANEGNDEVVQRLLQHPRIDPDLALSDGTTALMLSKQRGYKAVVNLLTGKSLQAKASNVE